METTNKYYADVKRYENDLLSEINKDFEPWLFDEQIEINYEALVSGVKLA